MDTASYLLLYITALVTSTWFSYTAASTETGTPNVPTTHSPGPFTTRRNRHYDVTSVAPEDIFQREIWPVNVQTADLPSDTASVHTVLLTHTSATDSEQEHRTVPFGEGALASFTTSSAGRTFESSVESLLELKNQHGHEFHTPLSHGKEETTLIENSDQPYETTPPNEHRTSLRNSTSAERRRTGILSTSSEESKSSLGESEKRALEDKTGHQNKEPPDAPVHRERNEELVTKANINHAALWITVAFVAVLLVYISVLIIYNAKKRDWHQSLPPYSRFLEETTREEQEGSSTLDKMLQRITGKTNIEDGYSLSF